MSSTSTPTKSISFEIEVEKTPVHSRTPSFVKKLEEVSNSLKNKRSLSQEDLQAKLDSAAERKKTIDESKAMKGKEAVEKAKATASRIRHESEAQVAEKLEKLKEKLDSAAEKKGIQESMKKMKIEQHLSTVDEIKKASSTPTKDVAVLTQKLQAAEIRRKALEEEKVNKLIEHHKAVEHLKEQRQVVFITLLNFSPNRASPDRFRIKLEAAEQRRKLIEKEQHEKLFKRQEYVKAVRKRKSAVNEENFDIENRVASV